MITPFGSPPIEIKAIEQGSRLGLALSDRKEGVVPDSFWYSS